MKKKMYVAPRVEQAELLGEVTMQSRSISADDIKFGGNASEFGITEADANKNNGWDLW